MARSITIEINDTSPQEIARGIGLAVAAVTKEVDKLPWQSVLADVMKEVQDIHGEYFATERAPSGSPWKALSPYTIAKKGFDQILHDSGRLQASLSGYGAGAIRSVEGRSLTFGTSVPYATYHETGFQNRRTDEPVVARPMVGLNTQSVDRLARSLADSIVRQL